MSNTNNYSVRAGGPNERGGALVLTLALVGALSALAVFSLEAPPDENQSSFERRNREQAFYIAQAGIREGLVELYRNDRWRAGFPYQEMAGGFYVVHVRDSIIKPELADTLSLQAQALFGGSAAAIEVSLARSRFYPFEYALFSQRALYLNQNVCVDSYDSDAGALGATGNSHGARVGANGIVTLGRYARIDGDLASAIRGGLQLDSGSVSGDTSSGAALAELPTQAALSFAHARANNRAPRGFSGSGYSYNSATDNLRIDSGETLELSSGVYYFNDISLRDHAHITLAAGARVSIFVNGEIVMRNQSSINRGGKPENFLVASRGKAFDMYHESEFRGAFYGLGVTFTARRWIDYYGSLIVAQASLYPDVCIHYDRSLREVSWEGKYGVVAWRES